MPCGGDTSASRKLDNMPLDLLAPFGAEQLLRQNYVHQLRQTINAYMPSYIFVGEALQNALDAVRDGGPGNHRIDVLMDFDERSVKVRDSGPGFPDKPNLLFLGGGDKQGRGLAGMVGVGLKVVLFSSDRFMLRATNAEQSLKVEIEGAHRYGDTPPPAITLPEPDHLPIDPSPVITTGTGTVMEYRFPAGAGNTSGIPEQYLRDVLDDSFSRSTPDFHDSLDNAVAKKEFPSRLAALVASHLRRFLYLGSTVDRAEFKKLTVQVTVKGSAASLGPLADLADGKTSVTFDVPPNYFTVDTALGWAKAPKPVVQSNALGDGGSNLSRTKLGFNRVVYSTAEDFKLLLTDARGKLSAQYGEYEAKLFGKLNSVTVTVGRIPQFNTYLPGGSRRVISSRGVVTQHSIEISSGQNQQYVRCIDLVVEVDADLNYGKTLLTDMHLVSNVRKFVNDAYRATLQNAARNYVGTIHTSTPDPVPFWSRTRLTDAGTLTVATVPYDENDVIALCFELCGRGVINWIRWFGLSSWDRYDARAVIKRDGDRDDLLDDPKETDLRIVEFKLRGARIARDFDREEKVMADIDLIICYEVDDSPIDSFQVVAWNDSAACQNGEVPYPGVVTVLLDTVTGREVQILALRDLLVPDIVEEPPTIPPEVPDDDES